MPEINIFLGSKPEEKRDDNALSRALRKEREDNIFKSLLLNKLNELARKIPTATGAGGGA